MNEALRATPEFQTYLRVRDAVLQMLDGRAAGAGHAADASDYWSEELGNIDYLVDASPFIVRKLRHHAFHITNLRPYDYRDKQDGRRQMFEARLQALKALDPAGVFVPESPLLGGFGYEIDGSLVNVDTLKFYEALIALQRGGVLAEVRAADRPVVCEIGAGWGGFPYQFKTVCPRARYVIVDFPELFLFSATYLGVAFPHARMVFGGVDGWEDADFVFVPNTRAHELARVPLDLTINMVSFQEMTEHQVRAYTRLAAEAECRAIYSFNREHSPYNAELASVSSVLAERYRLTEIPVLDTDYTSAMKKPPKKTQLSARAELGYRHVIGLLDGAAASVRPSTATGASHTAGDATGGPRVVLGMTLYNNAANLPAAMDSLLAQTFRDFQLLMLDDGSTDATQAIAREYEQRDARVHYARHESRRAMIATWREVAETAFREYPSAEFFAWVSDHDVWHPEWLARLVRELEGDPQAVLAYPITRRIGSDSTELDKGPRLFDTASLEGVRARWTHFCRHGVGAGDMVYGLMRRDALAAAGIFRTVLRPDKLVIAEMTLHGRIRQVPEVLWYRRQSAAPSIARQAHTLVLQDQVPRWFRWPPSMQHVAVLSREYARSTPPRMAVGRAAWAWMLAEYFVLYGWRHFRKSETFHSVNRALDGLVWVRKQCLHHLRHALYETLMSLRAFRGRATRARRRAVYRVLVTYHRLVDSVMAAVRGVPPAS